MMMSRRGGILWGMFALALVLAMWGWLWVVQRLLENEADAGAARVMEAEERYLHEVAPEVEGRIDAEIDAVIQGGGEGGEAMIPRLVRRGLMGGVWLPQDEATAVMDVRLIEDWRRRVREGDVTPEMLAAAFEKGELRWGWVEDGRDVVGGIVLSLMRQHSGDEVLRGMLEERVWDYSGVPLRPAFRLVLIRKLMELEPSPLVERLRVAEELRMTWGNTGAVKGHDLVRRKSGGKSIVFFWTKEQLEAVANQGGGTGFQLRESEEPGLAGARLEGPERWRVLGLAESGSMASAVGVNETALIWVGATSGLLVLALAVGAALLARKEYRLGQMRTDLAASVAHELRTPLAGQRLLLESLVERDAMPESERREYVEMSLRENLRLGRLAEEFLTFSRLERGVLALEEESVAPGRAVDEAVESLREKWEAPGCRLTVDVPEDLPPVAADEQALVTVVRNLLENAWKYSGEEKEIAVTAGEARDGVWIAVRDNGVGVAAADRERIFRQFYRVDQRLAREKDGLGIGLSIVRRLMRAMRGRVELESETGAGSEFKLWLPRES